MKKIMKVAFIFAFVTVLGTVLGVPSYAGSRVTGQANTGFCPAGTCAKDGGAHAKNMKNCSAANCAKH